ncbi:ATP-binding protein [Nevskia ramosa]|uniref:ATP-binding protein n=1 Tax=Nevskia ramosa TaxID=64002 RepID=UPI0003B6E634|nr:ATP-binding protein [Nevskia ramosa]
MVETTAPQAATFFGASGEMAERMARHDWASTTVGTPDSWPLSLQTAVRILLGSRFAMWVGWGDDLAFFYNDAYRPTLGIKHDWALGRATHEVWSEIWPDVKPRIDAVIGQGISTWDEALCLYLERGGDREETYHTFSYSPLVGDDGVNRGLLCVVVEETDRIIGEQHMAQLRDLATAFTAVSTETELFSTLERQLSAARQSVPFSITLLRDEANGGVSLAAQTGIPPEQRERLARNAERDWPLHAVLASGEPQIVAALPFGKLPMPPGEQAPTQAVLMPILGHGMERGRAVGVFIAGLNPNRPFSSAYADFLKLLLGQLSAALTSARAYDFERRRAEELAELDSAKTAFFSNVSHEFRTPLTLMLGPTEAALDSPGQTLAGEQLALVHRNQQRLLKLVNTLLDFSRIEAGRLELQFEPTDLPAFTLELASLFRSSTERAGLSLTVHCPALPEPVWIDREMWEQIILNLLSNAYKFTLSGSIAVSLVAAGSNVLLKVRDTGIGIPASELPQIFERFRRVKGSLGRTHEGTGIGLALVWELAKLHGGAVAVTSTPGIGTEFTVSIPIMQRNAQTDLAVEPRQPDLISKRARSYAAEAERWSLELEEPKPEPASPVQSRDNRPLIVLADDNADMRNYVKRLLSESCEVLAVGDGLEALEAIQRDKPDLVVSDVMMPGLGGFELLKALRADPATASIPLLLLSARAGEEARVEGLRAGADDYLTKPFRAQELVARVTSVLTLASTRREALRVEAKLKADRDSILESINEGFLSIDPDWTIAYANRAAEKLLAVQRADLLGGHFWALYPALDNTKYSVAVRGAMDDRTAEVFDYFYDPWNRWFEVSVYPTSSAGISIYFRDATERKQTLMALHDADRRKDEFLATLAHELRNPLSPIRNAAEVLSLPGIGSREISISTSIIQRQVQHMARLLDDLLDISRITRGKMELKKDHVSIDSVIDAALESAGPLVKARGHHLEVVRPAFVPGIDGDPVRLAQVLTNLLTNAAKYTDAPGRIALSANVHGNDLVFEVRDSGIGLTAEQLGGVFDMFSQVKSSQSRSEGGLGIGLTLVKGIVELHGGTIEARSPGLGLGSSFKLSLPIVRQATTAAQPPEQPQAAAVAPALRVLIADDNRDAAESLAILLEIDGHEVRTAFTGREAIALAQELKPHIAFLDIGLPDISGYEVAQALRATTEASHPIKLVAVTGWGQAEDKQNAVNAGFDLHFVKPASPDRLKSVFESLVP